MKQILQGSQVNEVEARIKAVLQESKLKDACNEAYDELLTQEFIPDQDDFEEDDVGHGDGDSLIPIEELALVPSDTSMIHQLLTSLHCSLV
jgi:hypothetical protein